MEVVCPVCKGEAREDRSKVMGDHHWINCPQCGGEYEIAGVYFSTLQHDNKPLPLLSAALRHAFEQHKSIPMLNQWSVQEILERTVTN